MTPQGTSIAETPFKGTSTIPTSMYGGAVGSGCPHVEAAVSSSHWWQKPETVIALMGMALTGVIGYFSAVLPLRDAISENLSRIKIAETKISHIEVGMKELKDSGELARQLDKDVAVLGAQVSRLNKEMELGGRK